jgi:hypothetical protein
MAQGFGGPPSWATSSPPCPSSGSMMRGHQVYEALGLRAFGTYRLLVHQAEA